MAADEQKRMTEEELEAHLQRFLDEGAGMDELADELARLGIYDKDLSPDGKTLYLPDEEVAEESNRPYWNIRDHAKKQGKEPQDVAEWVLRERRRLWKTVAKAERLYDRNLRQLKAWLATQKAPWKRFDGFAEFVLREYHEDFAEGDATIKLIDGDLVTRKNADRIEWANDLAMLEAAKRLRALPADATDKDLLDAAKSLFNSYKAGTLKEGLTVKKRQFLGSDGKPVSYVRKVAPAEARSFSIKQAGVGEPEAEDSGDAE